MNLTRQIKLNLSWHNFYFKLQTKFDTDTTNIKAAVFLLVDTLEPALFIFFRLESTEITAEAALLLFRIMLFLLVGSAATLSL